MQRMCFVEACFCSNVNKKVTKPRPKVRFSTNFLTYTLYVNFVVHVYFGQKWPTLHFQWLIFTYQGVQGICYGYTFKSVHSSITNTMCDKGCYQLGPLEDSLDGLWPHHKLAVLMYGTDHIGVKVQVCCVVLRFQLSLAGPFLTTLASSVENKSSCLLEIYRVNLAECKTYQGNIISKPVSWLVLGWDKSGHASLTAALAMRPMWFSLHKAQPSSLCGLSHWFSKLWCGFECGSYC